MNLSNEDLSLLGDALNRAIDDVCENLRYGNIDADYPDPDDQAYVKALPGKFRQLRERIFQERFIDKGE